MPNPEEIIDSSFEGRQPVDPPQIGGEVLRYTVLPPEDPDVVRERDNIPPDYTGRRPMTEIITPLAAGALDGDYVPGRRAPKSLGSMND